MNEQQPTSGDLCDEHCLSHRMDHEFAAETLPLAALIDAELREQNATYGVRGVSLEPSWKGGADDGRCRDRVVADDRSFG